MTTIEKLEEIIDELVSLVITLGDENRQLMKKLDQVKQYIAVYEEYIEGRE